MSHYPAAVFTENGVHEVDDLLEPYNEAITVPPYVRHTKEQLIQLEKELLQSVIDGPYAEWQKDPAKYGIFCVWYP